MHDERLRAGARVLDGDVENQRKFIVENGPDVKDLDV